MMHLLSLMLWTNWRVMAIANKHTPTWNKHCRPKVNCLPTSVPDRSMYFDPIISRKGYNQGWNRQSMILPDILQHLSLLPCSSSRVHSTWNVNGCQKDIPDQGFTALKICRIAISYAIANGATGVIEVLFLWFPTAYQVNIHNIYFLWDTIIFTILGYY